MLSKLDISGVKFKIYTFYSKPFLSGKGLNGHSKNCENQFSVIARNEATKQSQLLISNDNEKSNTRLFQICRSGFQPRLGRTKDGAPTEVMAFLNGYPI